MPVERLTEDLLRHIIAASSPDEYLAEGETVDRAFPITCSIYFANAASSAPMSFVRRVCIRRLCTIFSRASLIRVAIMRSCWRLAWVATSLKRSGFCDSPVCPSFGRRFAAMPL